MSKHFNSVLKLVAGDSVRSGDSKNLQIASEKDSSSAVLQSQPHPPFGMQQSTVQIMKIM